MGNKKKKLDLDLALIDKYCTSSNPVYDIIPLKLSFDFMSLDEHEKEDLREYANIENGHIERWILVPDTVSLGALSYIICRAFGLPGYVFSTAFTMDEEEQREVFPTMEDALAACGSVFDNPIETDYILNLQDIAEQNYDYFPSIPMTMMLSPTITYKEAQEKVMKETEKVRKSGVEINGKKMKLSELPGLPSLLYEKTGDKEFDWCDELCRFLEIKDVLIAEGKPRPDFKKRFKGQRCTAQNGRKKGAPFCYSIYMDIFFDDDFAFEIKVERPKNVMPLIKEGYIDLEDYLESIRYVSRAIRPDCIYKSGYDLFCYSEASYYAFIMMMHGAMRSDLIQEAVRSGWNEPSMDLKKVFR